MAYSIDEVLRLMQETSRLHLKKVWIEENGQKIVINGQELPQASPAVSERAGEVGTGRETEAPRETGEGKKVVTSPIVGIFYTAPGPDARPFVQVGDSVRKGQVLCIVEAMKLMNEIESEYDGQIVRILAENESMVEYGQPLFEVEVPGGTEQH